MTFTWRETPIASSNHDLSYARSRDLVNWETSDGTAIPLPIRLATGEVIDPIPEHGGLLNGRHPIGFDAENRVLVTYQKYDEDNLSQVFIARRDPSASSEYYLSWEALQPNRDQARANIPPASTLRVHRIPQ